MPQADKNLYVLVDRHGSRWLFTLATNRRDSWQKARQYTRDPNGNWKRELKAKVRCARVRLVEIEQHSR